MDGTHCSHVIQIARQGADGVLALHSVPEPIRTQRVTAFAVVVRSARNACRERPVGDTLVLGD